MYFLYHPHRLSTPRNSIIFFIKIYAFFCCPITAVKVRNLAHIGHTRLRHILYYIAQYTETVKRAQYSSGKFLKLGGLIYRLPSCKGLQISWDANSVFHSTAGDGSKQSKTDQSWGVQADCWLEYEIWRGKLPFARPFTNNFAPPYCLWWCGGDRIFLRTGSHWGRVGSSVRITMNMDMLSRAAVTFPSS